MHQLDARHTPENAYCGWGASLLEAFTGKGGALPTVAKLGVRGMPGSGTPAELLDAAGISAKHVIEAVKSLL